MSIRQIQFRSRGIALMLVIAVVAVVSILGLALLASATLRAESKANATRAVQAMYLAESGVNLAMYHMQHPETAPTLNNGVYAGESDLNLNAATPGTVDVSITPSPTAVSSEYDINSIAYSGYDATHRLMRSLKVRVDLKSYYLIDSALSTAGNFTMPTSMTVIGNVRCDGTFTQTSADQSGNGGAGTVAGTVRALGSNLSAFQPLPTFPTTACPKLSQMNVISTIHGPSAYYVYLDDIGVERVGSAEVLPSVVNGSLTAASNNPRAIFYSNDDVTFGDCNIDGSIILCGSDKSLTVSGTAHITSRSRMPALVVGDSIAFQAGATAKALTVDGLCWIGGAGIKSTTPHTVASNSTMTVHGAMMFAGAAAAISNDFDGTITLAFDSVKGAAPLLSDVNRTPHGIHIVRWGL